ncbi:MAG: hypothetical protein MZV65_44050 [Chromatiales bacterium]|nr:hypothetical protein [Chromatiales bacterium]
MIAENCPACFSHAHRSASSMKQQLVGAGGGSMRELFNSLRSALKPLMGGIPGVPQEECDVGKASAAWRTL